MPPSNTLLYGQPTVRAFPSVRSHLRGNDRGKDIRIPQCTGMYDSAYVSIRVTDSSTSSSCRTVHASDAVFRNRIRLDCAVPPGRTIFARADHVRTVCEPAKDTWQRRAVEEGYGMPRSRGEEGGGKLDMVTLGNLCVDVLVKVEELPPTETEGKRRYMESLVAAPPDESFWEGGGMANTLIAASRLGLRCLALGHVGEDVFGDFFGRILGEEGVGVHDLGVEGESLGGDDYGGETLVVWVMIDGGGKHAFCSRFDFNSEPVFSRLTSLMEHSEGVISNAKALFINGFTFDEIPPSAVLAAAEFARKKNTSVFFDPGPRTAVLAKNRGEDLARLVALSDVVLLTEEEAEVLTGERDAERGAERVLAMGGGRVHWVVIKKGAQGCLLKTREGELYTMPGFKVPVSDTVGCGDSFASAVALGYNDFHNTRGVHKNNNNNRGVHPSLRCTLALANAVGAATAMGEGGGRRVATRERVEEILMSVQAEDDEVYVGDKDFEVSSIRDKKLGSEKDKIYVNGPVTCPSGIPLHVSVKGALDLLRAKRRSSTVPYESTEVEE